LVSKLFLIVKREIVPIGITIFVAVNAAFYGYSPKFKPPQRRLNHMRKTQEFSSLKISNPFLKTQDPISLIKYSSLQPRGLGVLF
jgi:hypothetical protein